MSAVELINGVTVKTKKERAKDTRVNTEAKMLTETPENQKKAE